MRIERIDSAKDAAKWAGDQALHGLVVAICALPWPLNAAIVLVAREYMQWRNKSEIAKFAERQLPFWKRHIDRVLDVVLGVLIGAGVVYGLRAIF